MRSPYSPAQGLDGRATWTDRASANKVAARGRAEGSNVETTPCATNFREAGKHAQRRTPSTARRHAADQMPLRRLQEPGKSGRAT